MKGQTDLELNIMMFPSNSLSNNVIITGDDGVSLLPSGKGAAMEFEGTCILSQTVSERFSAGEQSLSRKLK